MHPSPCSETTSPCPSVRSSTTGGYTARAHGRPEETTVQLAPRQAARDARDRGAEGERLPELRAAQAAASRLRELWDVQGPRGRAAPHRRALADTCRASRSTQWGATAGRRRSSPARSKPPPT